MYNHSLPIDLECIYLPVVNFAFQQNRVSIIRQLSIENLTDEALKGLQVTISVNPGFGTALPVHIDSVPARETVRIETLTLDLSTDFLMHLTERISGYFVLEVKQDDTSLFRKNYPIDILAYDQWSGTTALPEMLAAFVTPNHPDLVPIINRAAVILTEWTGNPSMDAYQSRNPDRVRKQMAAVYAAIAEQEILYSTIPASFEAYGQRIRMVDTVMSQKLATCLDMAILYASCLEAIGIHALLILVEGHAYAGGWLIPETFPDDIVDDASSLTKRAAEGINDLVLVETTAMNMGQQIAFDQAVEMGYRKLGSTRFVLALDVRRARLSGIRPIPQRVFDGQTWSLIVPAETPTGVTHAAPQTINPYDLSGISPEVTVTKQLLWERKLLDLSLRNNLLNIRITRNTLQLITADLHLFEDALADGGEFRILNKPADWNNPLCNFGVYHPVAGSDPVMDLIRSEVSQHRLRSYLTETELSTALTHLYRSSRTSMEENGANTLYLALGLLKWYESPASERPRYAPVLLVPVEIVRKSAAKGYVIRSRDEETMMNITLLEMLKQNFNIHVGGLTPLPTDQRGVNLNLIFSILRNTIKEQARWDVEEQAILGIFSFNKFTMWNDIHTHADTLSENKIVASLVSGRIEWEAEEGMADASELDKHLSPAEVMLPVSADSSQLEAIYEASRGKSFILHGPPGTGKSQTITNLIANAIYWGKRVLFVAEKMAALSVVQSRLEAIGLAPFCLELHSNKTKKTAILAQLRHTAEVVKRTSPEAFRSEADRLLALRTELNVYIEALHRVYPFGLSLYDAITRCLALDGVEPLFAIPRSYFSTLDKETIRQWEEAIEQLVMTAHACGHPHNHPLTGITLTNYSTDIKEEASQAIRDVLEVLQRIRPEQRFLPELFGEWTHTTDRAGMKMLSLIIEKLLRIPELTPALLTRPLEGEDLEEYRKVCRHGKERDDLKQEITSQFSDGVLAIDASGMLIAWKQAAGNWFLPRFFAQRKIKSHLKGFTYQGIDKAQIQPVLERIIRYKEERDYVETHAGEFALLFGKQGRKGSEKWEVIESILTDIAAINDAVFGYARSMTEATAIKEALSRQMAHGVAPYRRVHGEVLTRLVGLLGELNTREDRLCGTLGADRESLYTGTAGWIDAATLQLEQWQAHLHRLKEWYQWQLVSDRLYALKIGFVAGRYAAENIDTSRVADIFRKSLYKAACEYIISQDRSLELFNGNLFAEVIEKYKRLTADFQELTRQELVARLASNLPSFAREATQTSEVGILQRNLRNNARGISVRRLFDQIPTLLSRMCPCMLMSPISVAQYIDADADKFDLVVFDEASQMPTYEAVGAIARGRNVVIVGDPKQMPPTSFFAVNTVDEENIEMEDLESILDDCLALSMPSSHLLWHYRSKHESLIAFSNAEYYDNKLLTFPSPDDIESKVRMVHIDGVYDKGKTRQNRAEAQAVVEEIARRLRDAELRKWSIGVVTFSVVQQSLIEDLLSELFVKYPDLETLALECEEPLFIKNLENVQGDERDVILFSVGYGPDKEGKVSMNFGPLNREGGERRLNVAVSRARYEMVIYSTLKAEQIDLNRTSARGVAGLKRFLEYAQSGENMVSNAAVTMESEVSIHALIARRLRAEGYTVHTNIGSSGYKIDIGIVDTDNPARYRLGIICDGDNYRRTKTMRDREIVQNSVLKMLGWNICRVWTLDWWEDPDRVIAKIREALERTEEPADIPEREESTVVPEERFVDAEENDSDLNKQQDAEKEKQTGFSQPYTQARLSPLRAAEDFYHPVNRSVIVGQIAEVMQAEAPVSRALLYRQILAAWGISRIGTRSGALLERLFEQAGYYQTEYGENVFCWIDKEQHNQYGIFRTGAGRNAVDVPPVEVANAMRQIVQDEISLPVADLIKIGSQVFGFARSGTKVDAAMQRGVEEAVRRGYLKVDSGQAVVL